MTSKLWFSSMKRYQKETTVRIALMPILGHESSEALILKKDKASEFLNECGSKGPTKDHSKRGQPFPENFAPNFASQVAREFNATRGLLIVSSKGLQELLPETPCVGHEDLFILTFKVKPSMPFCGGIQDGIVKVL